MRSWPDAEEISTLSEIPFTDIVIELPLADTETELIIVASSLNQNAHSVRQIV